MGITVFRKEHILKNKKKKLAALALCFMLSIPGFSARAMAEGEDYPTHAHSSTTIAGYTVDQESIQWIPDENGDTCTVNYFVTNGNIRYKVTGAKAEWWNGHPADCTAPDAKLPFFS